MKYIRYCSICGKPKIYKTLDSFITNKHSLLCRSCARKKVFREKSPNKLNKLLEDTCESYYWIGYLLADGHFGNDRLKFTQNGQDQISVKRFKKYINCKNKILVTNNSTTSEISVMDKTVIPLITQKFDIKPNKTYYPPKNEIFEKMDINLLSYLFIGFVDGDGNIGNLHNRKDFNLRIKLHSSWYNILKIFENRLFCTNCHTKIDKKGYAVFYIGNTELLKDFKKNFVLNINFDILNRKWDKINLNYIGKKEKSKIDFLNIMDLYNKNFRISQICEKLDLKYNKVYKHIQKLKKNVYTKN